jgi:hypothetical protein
MQVVVAVVRVVAVLLVLAVVAVVVLGRLRVQLLMELQTLAAVAVELPTNITAVVVLAVQA